MKENIELINKEVVRIDKDFIPLKNIECIESITSKPENLVKVTLFSGYSLNYYAERIDYDELCTIFSEYQVKDEMCI